MLTQCGLERKGCPLLLKWGEIARAAKGNKSEVVPHGISSLSFPVCERNNQALLHFHWHVSALRDSGK